MTTLFCFASIQLRPNADHDMLSVGRSARDLFGTLAAWSKKKAGDSKDYLKDKLAQADLPVSPNPAGQRPLTIDHRCP